MSMTSLKSSFRTTSFSMVMSDKWFNRWSVIVVRSSLFTRPRTEKDRSPQQFVTKSDRYYAQNNVYIRECFQNTRCRSNTVQAKLKANFLVLLLDSSAPAVRKWRSAQARSPDRGRDLPDTLQPAGWNFCGSTLGTNRRFRAKIRTNFELHYMRPVFSWPVMLSIIAKHTPVRNLSRGDRFTSADSPSNRFTLTLRTFGLSLPCIQRIHSAPCRVVFEDFELFSQCRNVFTQRF